MCMVMAANHNQRGGITDQYFVLQELLKCDNVPGEGPFLSPYEIDVSLHPNRLSGQRGNLQETLLGRNGQGDKR